MGAMQAQDYPGAKWGIGLRGARLTDAAVEEAFGQGRILRTHLQRPTWHFVAPADIRWMLALTASRVHTANGPCYRRYGLDSTLLARSRQVLERTLAGDRHMTRAELATALRQDGIAAAGMRLAYLMMHAELEGVVCSGARRGKQMTYALLAERAPLATVMPRDQALSALAARYVASHGPATVRDFCWWAGADGARRETSARHRHAHADTG